MRARSCRRISRTAASCPGSSGERRRSPALGRALVARPALDAPHRGARRRRRGDAHRRRRGAQRPSRAPGRRRRPRHDRDAGHRRGRARKRGGLQAGADRDRARHRHGRRRRRAFRGHDPARGRRDRRPARRGPLRPRLRRRRAAARLHHQRPLARRRRHACTTTSAGLADLEARRVRFIGEPAARIREDYLRILRFFRFHAAYGEGPLDRPASRRRSRSGPGSRCSRASGSAPSS